MLNRDEQRKLDALESVLDASDPELSALLGRRAAHSRRRRALLPVVAEVIGGLLTVLGLVTSNVLIIVAGLVSLLSGLVVHLVPRRS